MEQARKAIYNSIKENKITKRRKKSYVINKFFYIYLDKANGLYLKNKTQCQFNHFIKSAK